MQKSVGLIPDILYVMVGFIWQVCPSSRTLYAVFWSSYLVQGEVYSIQHYVIKFVMTCNRSVVFSGYLSQSGLVVLVVYDRLSIYPWSISPMRYRLFLHLHWVCLTGILSWNVYQVPGQCTVVFLCEITGCTISIFIGTKDFQIHFN